MQSGSLNTALGTGSLPSITSGSGNCCVGYHSGSSYTGSESNNILLQHSGVNGESNFMRLGSQGSGSTQVNITYIAGIYNISDERRFLCVLFQQLC